jgi:shikimate kinase
VVLVGPPGSGKSTTGRRLAEQLGVGFRDTDTEVEARAGKPIGEIFVDEGEPAFRAMEREAVRIALDEHDGVLALGGGAVGDAQTRAWLADHRVAFLDVGLTDAVRRVGLNRARSLLLGNVRSQLKQLMDARRPLYQEVATVTVPTDGRSPEQVAAEILTALGVSA